MMDRVLVCTLLHSAFLQQWLVSRSQLLISMMLSSPSFTIGMVLRGGWPVPGLLQLKIKAENLINQNLVSFSLSLLLSFLHTHAGWVLNFHWFGIRIKAHTVVFINSVSTKTYQIWYWFTLMCVYTMCVYIFKKIEANIVFFLWQSWQKLEGQQGFMTQLWFLCRSWCIRGPESVLRIQITLGH